jgi:hypothetical protein
MSPSMARGLVLTYIPKPVPTFLLVQNGLLFFAGPCGGGFCKAKMDPRLQLAGMTDEVKQVKSRFSLYIQMGLSLPRALYSL